jgi:hypothetical protein
MITEEIKNKNYELYLKKLSQLGIDTTLFAEIAGDKLKEATFTNTNDFGNAYPGSLIEIVLKVLTPYAVKLNELLPEEQRVDKNTLVKICLLHHIAKAVRLVPNDNQWEIDKRGFAYKFAELDGCLKFGERSALNALNLGVRLSPVEFEAICSLDKDGEEARNRKYVVDILTTIVRQANELAYAIERERLNKVQDI